MTDNPNTPADQPKHTGMLFDVDGQQAVVHGAADMDDATAEAIAEMIRAVYAKRAKEKGKTT